jgi:HSP20 family molecular chaperone IbpA
MRVERPSGPFIRRIALPEDAQLNAMTTFFRNGVMELRVPRALPRQGSSEVVELVE